MNSVAVGAGVYVAVGDAGVLEGVKARAVHLADWFWATRVSNADLLSPGSRVGSYSGVVIR
jgi:hypothetical protein